MYGSKRLGIYNISCNLPGQCFAGWARGACWGNIAPRPPGSGPVGTEPQVSGYQGVNGNYSKKTGERENLQM